MDVPLPASILQNTVCCTIGSPRAFDAMGKPLWMHFTLFAPRVGRKGYSALTMPSANLW